MEKINDIKIEKDRNESDLLDMELKEMIHPDRCPLLTSEELWDKYLDDNAFIFAPRAARSEDFA